jgi:hypothetical protein
MSNVKIKANASGTADFTIEAPATDSALTLTLPDTQGTLATTNQLGGRRNLIINGAMQVAQRNTSVTVSDGSNEGYSTVDRFNFQVTGLTGVAYTASQSTDAPDNFSNSLKLDCTTAASLVATTNTRFYQRIEAKNLQHLGYGTSGAKSLTASFWVKSNKTGSYGLWFYNVDAGRAISRLYTIDSADTWEYKTVTIPGDTSGSIDNDSGYGLEMRFAIAMGSDVTSGTLATNWGSPVNANRHAGHNANIGLSTDDYWQITGVQLEVGSVATPFEHRSYGEELALCMRYFERMTNEKTTQGTYHSRKLFGMCYAENTSEARGALRYATKRSEPTISYNAVNAFALYHTGSSLVLAGLSFDNTSLDVARILLTSSGTPLIDGSACHFSSYSSSTEAYVDIDAEL